MQYERDVSFPLKWKFKFECAKDDVNVTTNNRVEY